MDILLSQGDHGANSGGIPQTVKGFEEIIQRALLRLSIPKGSFPYDLELGSELGNLGSFSPESTDRAALSYATEALRDLPEVRVVSASCQRVAGDVLVVLVELELDQKHVVLEVKY